MTGRWWTRASPRPRECSIRPTARGYGRGSTPCSAARRAPGILRGPPVCARSSCRTASSGWRVPSRRRRGASSPRPPHASRACCSWAPHTTSRSRASPPPSPTPSPRRSARCTVDRLAIEGVRQLPADRRQRSAARAGALARGAAAAAADVLPEATIVPLLVGEVTDADGSAGGRVAVGRRAPSPWSPRI